MTNATSQFGFYKVGSGTAAPLSIVTATDIEEARRLAVAAIKTEGLEAIRIWIDGRKTIEVKRPTQPVQPAAQSSPADDRRERMRAKRAEGASFRAIGEEFGISAGRVKQIVEIGQRRRDMKNGEPNRAALPVRVRNALSYMIEEPETDPAERDQRLPGRLAVFTKKAISDTPNLGKQAVGEVEAWLWERGLSFAA